mgnify:CR=1 FL=1
MASTFSTLIKRGYGAIYAVRIEGIPYTFHEGPTPYRVDAESFPSAGTGYTSSASFMVLKDMTIDQEIDRHSSIARGKALTINLAWSVMESEDILDKLFRRPAYHTTLTADVGAEDTTINVASTADFPSSGTFYIGRELIKYTSKTSNTFVVDTSEGGSNPGRGYLGYKYRFRKDDPGSHGMITPTPLSWKGRFVTIYEHLVSPQGRILDSTFCTGQYQRELWKGYINAPPVPNAFGMTLSAFPLVRLAGQELGSTLQAKTIGMNPENVSLTTEELLDYPVYVNEGATMTWTLYKQADTSLNPTADIKVFPEIETGATEADWPKIPPGAMTIRTYLQAMCDGIMATLPAGSGDLPAYNLYSMSVLEQGEKGQVVIGMEIGPTDMSGGGTWYWSVEVTPNSGCYWFFGGENILSLSEVVLTSPEDADYGVAIMPIAFDIGLTLPTHIAVKDIEGNSAIDFTINSTGLGVITAGDNSEVIEWDAKYTQDYKGTSFSPWALLSIKQQMVGAQYSTVSQLPADLNEDGTLDVVAGVVASLDVAALTLLQSSGTEGLRGTYDTLGLGFGLGIPEEWTDLNGTGGSLITGETLPILAIGRSSWGQLFSGWYAISGVCLVQRLDETDGVIKLMKVHTSPAEVISTDGKTFLGVQLAKEDVVVGGTQVPKLVVAPNQIVVDTTAGPYESADYTYNAVGRIQSEGATSVSLAIPGGRPDIVAPAILSIMSRGLGQSIIQFKVAPWVEAQLGDPVSVTVGHPVLFDWSDGTRQPSNLPGRVVGTSYKMKSGEKTLTILLDGLLEPGFWLCPSTKVVSVSGDDVTVTDGSWFRSGETVRFYREGNEASQDVSIVATTVSGNVLSLASTPPGWINTSPKAYVTYPTYTSGSSSQTAAFMYDKSDKKWR